MDATQDVNSDSWESSNSFSSVNNFTSKNGYLCFFSKITEELQTHFKRNSGKDDYCDDIYEDIYITPQSGSGSYSYYKDLLTMAQNKNTTSEATRLTLESSKIREAKTIMSEATYSWTFSGYANPSVGLGPLQELFKVLEPPPYEFCIQPAYHTSSSANVESHFQEGFEMANLASGEMYNASEDGYSDFIDIFRWSSDTFPIEFLPVNPNDF